MGLDFSHADVKWSYSSFNHFRQRLATQIGVNLHVMKGFALGDATPISWDTVKDDIVPLLSHSDCDGALTPEECRKVAPRLRELVSRWPEHDRDKEKALLLAQGMELAASRNEDLEFL